MIRIINFKGGNLLWGSIEDIQNKKDLTFVDVFKPTPDELNKISHQTKIPLDEINEAIDPSERPHIYEGEKHSIIIIRVPVDIRKNGATTIPIAIFASKNLVVVFRNKEFDVFDSMKDLTSPSTIKKFEGGASHLVYSIIDDSISRFFRFVDMVDDQINLIEAKIYRKPKDVQVKKIFLTKKTLIYFHKALIADREVISTLQKEHLPIFSKKDLRFFQNTYNDITELLDLESTYRDILTGALDVYLTSVSNNLNQVIKKMTAMGSFILIPTLITGIYGMNFIIMPEIKWVYGYPFALSIMILSVILLYIYFKKKQWL